MNLRFLLSANRVKRNSYKLLLTSLVSILLAGVTSCHDAAAQITGDSKKSVDVGKIAFVSSRDRRNKQDANFEIYIMKSDGSGQNRLTKTFASESTPSFNRNGSEIAFMTFRDGNGEIYAMNADGTGQIRLTENEQWDGDPIFTPNGKQVIFRSRASGKTQIYRMKVGSSDMQMLTNTSVDKSDVTINTEGEEIAFSALIPKDRKHSYSYLFLMNADGTDVKQLRQGEAPAFSPDGRQLAFVSANAIHTMNLDGTQVKRLTPQGVAGDGSPSWSPDGKKLVFDSIDPQRSKRSLTDKLEREDFIVDTDCGKRVNPNSDIYTMDSDGTHINRLTRDSGNNTRPNWGPTFIGKLPLPQTPIPVIFPPPPPPPAPVQLNQPVAQRLESDPVQLTLENAAFGRLVYSFANSDPATTGLTISNLAESNATQETAKNSVVSRLVKPSTEAKEGTPAPLFAPQFSPDGRYVLFEYGSHYLHVLDTQSGLIQQVAHRPSLRYVQWSPDSQYIAYVSNGNADGSTMLGSCDDEPPTLYISNWRSGEQYAVASGNSLVSSFSWLAPHTLVYGMLSAPKQKIWQQSIGLPAQNNAGGNLPTKITTQSVQPDLYSFSLQDKKSKVLIEDGFAPLVSPDGQLVAFFGSANSNKPFALSDDWQNDPSWRPLVVSNIDGSRRHALQTFKELYPYVLWRKDNRHLLTVMRSWKDGEAVNPPQAEIVEWDTTTGLKRLVTTIRAEFPVAQGEVVPNTEIIPLGNSRIDDKLVVCIRQKTNAPSPYSYLTHKSIVYAIDLQSGDVTTLARLDGDSGLSWHD